VNPFVRISPGDTQDGAVLRHDSTPGWNKRGLLLRQLHSRQRPSPTRFMGLHGQYISAH
jgi:hypothetical protein